MKNEKKTTAYQAYAYGALNPQRMANEKANEEARKKMDEARDYVKETLTGHHTTSSKMDETRAAVKSTMTNSRRFTKYDVARINLAVQTGDNKVLAEYGLPPDDEK